MRDGQFIIEMVSKPPTEPDNVEEIHCGKMEDRLDRKARGRVSKCNEGDAKRRKDSVLSQTERRPSGRDSSCVNMSMKTIQAKELILFIQEQENLTLEESTAQLKLKTSH